MRVGIDISQIVFEGTGVGRYVREMVGALLKLDKKNEYVLFGSSLRQRHKFQAFYAKLRRNHQNVRLVTVPFPPVVLDLLWNRWHVVPVEWLVGKIDVFWSSDWTQPPLAHAQGITTVHDLSTLREPQSAHDTIVAVHKRRLEHAKQECRAFLCDSEATKQDVIRLLGLEAGKIHVIYPGLS